VATIEGLPAGLPISTDFINHELWRRQQGYGRGGRMKIETDTVQILAGVRHGETLGSPVAIMVENRDFKNWQEVMAVEPPAEEIKRERKVIRPRPGHADLVGGMKYDRRDLRDILERASARETTMRVAVGAFAKLLLRAFGCEIASHVVALGEISLADQEVGWDAIKAVYDNDVLRVADKEAEKKMVARIDQAAQEGAKLDGQLAQAIMSVHAVKAVELGDGVSNALKPGSQVHDEIVYNPDERRFG